MHIDTKCVHSGGGADTITGGINTPIFPSSAHDYLDADDPAYPRYFNTFNQKVLVEKICELEGAEDGLVFSSGMAAISSVLLSFLKAGDHVVLQDEIYGGSHAFVEGFFDRFGINYSFVGTSVEAMEAAIRAETRVLFIETPTNPMLNVIDIRAVADAARRSDCITVIDNTFATPILQNPIDLGIDIVVHSGTKYLGGHSDLSCGAVLSDQFRPGVQDQAHGC
jgi:cystathionine beta-lyase